MLRPTLLLALPILVAARDTSAADRPFGLDERPRARPYLDLPPDDHGSPPPLLSGTGAFEDVRSLSTADALIPYGIIAPFWSDGAEKIRWVSIPHDGRAKAGDAPDGAWSFPAGTVFIKHFEIATDETRPGARRRLETRLLVRDATGDVYGLSYRWRPDGSDAELVPAARVETLTIRTAAGVREQGWYYPGPADCRQCHTHASGGVLGVKASQLDRDFAYPSGVTDNQVRTWSHLGLIEPDPSPTTVDRTPRLARYDDPGRTLEDRARSYLDANCSQCHRPGGVAADFDARFSTPLADQRLIGAPVRINLGIDSARLVAPNDPWRSAILTRVTTRDATKMPPLAHEVVDHRGAELLRAWIASLPRPPVLPPPVISPSSGDFRHPVRVVLAHPDPAATIRYTLDGSPPGKSSPAYLGPFEVDVSTTVRARADRPGWTRSIVTQETFVIDP